MEVMKAIFLLITKSKTSFNYSISNIQITLTIHFCFVKNMFINLKKRNEIWALIWKNHKELKGGKE